ncbi:MAG: hypothetical protein PHI55_15260 [Burkholderiaceae bacterium]|nr:hypothetical protein [Burkholderiaceae bacterium]
MGFASFTFITALQPLAVWPGMPSERVLPHRAFSLQSGPTAFPPFGPESAPTGTACCRPARRSVRVLHPAAKAPASRIRMVISGRMADVCAELERMAASEALPSET